jgi:hypothetical protein
MAAIGMANENLPPDDTSMAAHVTHLCAMLGEEGFSYPVGGPRALCHALASVIEQCDGRVLRDVGLQELLFDPPPPGEKNATAKDDGAAAPSGVAGGGPKSRCRGLRLQDGCEVKVSEGRGTVLSTMGFIATFLHLLPSDLRSVHGVPPVGGPQKLLFFQTRVTKKTKLQSSTSLAAFTPGKKSESKSLLPPPPSQW